jgi:hypothetical protein
MFCKNNFTTFGLANFLHQFSNKYWLILEVNLTNSIPVIFLGSYCTTEAKKYTIDINILLVFLDLAP